MAAYRAAPVTASMLALNDKARLHAQGVSTAQDQLVACAVIIGASSDAAKEQYKAAVEKTLLLNANIEAYQQALHNLSTSYQPSDQRTDFGARLEADAAAILAQKRYAPSRDPVMQEVMKDLGLQADEAGQADEEDDDLALVTTGADKFLNTKCPLTMTLVFELQDPVEDLVGYIYDRKALTSYISSYNGRAPCPQSGTSHSVTVAELKPARALAREKRRLALQATQGNQLATQADKRVGQDEVLDVD